MCILMFIPMVIVCYIIERPVKEPDPPPKPIYRKRTQREFI